MIVRNNYDFSEDDRKDFNVNEICLRYDNLMAKQELYEDFSLNLISRHLNIEFESEMEICKLMNLCKALLNGAGGLE